MNMKQTRVAMNIIWVFMTLTILSACTSVPVDERAAVRDEINRDMDEAIASLVADDPDFQKRIDDSVGYYFKCVTNKRY